MNTNIVILFYLFILQNTLLAFDISDSIFQNRPLNFGVIRNERDFVIADNPNLKKVFAPDFVWNINSFSSRSKYEDMISLLRKNNRKPILCRYNSATTAKLLSNQGLIPYAFPLEKCKKDWLLRDKDGFAVPYRKRIKGTTSYTTDGRYYLDLRKTVVREAVINEMVSRALEDGLDATSYDNCHYNIALRGFPIPVDEWNETMISFFKEATYVAKENGLLCFFNVGGPASNIPETLYEIADFADGWLFETAFHPEIIKNNKLDEEIKAYSWALKKGKIILLVPKGRTIKDEEFALKIARKINVFEQGRIFVTQEIIDGTRKIHNNDFYITGL